MNLSFDYFSVRMMVAGIILLSISQAAFPAEKVVESTHPMYYGKVDGDRLISLTIPPRELILDMNPVNSIKSEANDFKQARYYFPNADTPLSVVKNLERIYRFDRRRDVPIVSSSLDWVIAEYFKANSHVPICRFRLLGKSVERQEQLDFSGKVVKIILIGWAPRNSTEDEERVPDLSVLGEHPAWIRVLRVTPDGRKTLVAEAWKATDVPFDAPTDSEPKASDLYFGLPNGARRWRSIADFTKYNEIDLHAACLSGAKPR
ncbi:TPA: hypothetical protein QDB02_006005 [Burkholderia vietnamiensis]|nr:hypothetical protein [Burkholderia vietnamiensis]